MKALTKKLLPLTVLTIAVTSLFSVQPAQAYTVRLKEVGANVVANGSGAINLTGLFHFNSHATSAGVFANEAYISMGSVGGLQDIYSGFTGPTNFGSGGFLTLANTSSGDPVGIWGDSRLFGIGLIFVPPGYVSNHTLSDSITFNNSTFATLGLTPGTYEWSWGTGLRNQNFTLIIGGAGVPDGGSTASLLGFGLLGLAALRRKLPWLRGRKS
jgi:protein with PEP-CTERM/exosortase system signal